MVVAGIDVGAATAKAVIMADGEILGYCVIPTGHSIKTSAEEVMKLASEKANVTTDNFDYVVSTGYGRHGIPFANKAVTEITCHAKGVSSSIPLARTIIDIGGQDSKVIGIDDRGIVNNFVMNDKCAAGTGRFLEVMSGVLELSIEELGPTALLSKEPCSISTTCTVFAESEMVSLRAEGKSKVDLVGGIIKSVSSRVVVMGRSVGFKEKVVFTGGVAKNIGVKKALEDEIGLEIWIPDEPQIMGALGAALMAQVEFSKTS